VAKEIGQDLRSIAQEAIPGIRQFLQDLPALLQEIKPLLSDLAALARALAPLLGDVAHAGMTVAAGQAWMTGQLSGLMRGRRPTMPAKPDLDGEHFTQGMNLR
jgi:hypothetical protein